MAHYVVLGARLFDFTNDKAQRFHGIKVTYIDMAENTPSARGYQPMTINGDAEMFPEFSQGAGLYDLDFRMRPDRQGKPVLTLHSAKLVHPMDLSSDWVLEVKDAV